MTSSAARHVAAASVGVLSQGLGRLVASVLVGRVGGAGVLGSMATVLAVGQILVSLWPGSLGSTGVKFVAQSRGRGAWATIAQIQGHLALRALQGCLVLGLVGGAGWALAGGTWAECLVTGVVVFALGTSGLVQGFLYAERRTLTSSLREAAAAALTLGLLAAMLAYDDTIAGAWLALPLAVGLLLFAASGWPRQRPASMGARGRELDLFTLTSALGSVSSQGFLQMSVVAASTIGRESAGQFAVALALCTPLTLVISPLGLVLFPALNEAVGRGDAAGVRRQISVATRFLAYVLLGGAGVMVLCREPVIAAVWGPEFAEAGQIFIPLIAASVLGAVALPSVNGLTSASQTYATRATVLAGVSALVGTASWFVLVPAGGATGIAFGLLIGRALFAVAAMEAARRLHGISSWAGLAVRVALILALVATVDQLLASIVAQVLVFCVAAVAVAASDAPTREFCREQVPWLARR